MDLPIAGTGTTADPIVLTGENGTCAIQFLVPEMPDVTHALAESTQKNKRWHKPQRRITATQKGVRVRFVALATLQADPAARPTVSAAPVACRSDSAGAAEIRLADNQVDHLAWQSEETGLQCGSPLKTGRLETDGLLALVRVIDGEVTGYVLGEGTYLKWDGQVLVESPDSVCVTADADGAEVFGRRRARKGLPPVQPKDVEAVRPGR
jgi:hypothetical protein